MITVSQLPASRNDGEREECEYLDTCPTTVFWKKRKEKFIKEVCKTAEHENCSHRMGLEIHYNIPLIDENEERKRFKKKVQGMGKKKKGGNCLMSGTIQRQINEKMIDETFEKHGISIKKEITGEKVSWTDDDGRVAVSLSRERDGETIAIIRGDLFSFFVNEPVKIEYCRSGIVPWTEESKDRVDLEKQ
jgi:hypothetical protein